MVSGLVSGGMHVFTLGPLPTNGLAMLTKSMKANMGIMIHNNMKDNFFTINKYNPKIKINEKVALVNITRDMIQLY